MASAPVVNVQRSVVLLLACLLVPIAGPGGTLADAAPATGPVSIEDGAIAAWQDAVRFEPNHGQAPEGVLFTGHGPGPLQLWQDRLVAPGTTIVLEGAAPRAVRGDGAASPVVTHYLLGSDPDAWEYDVPHHTRIVYEHSWPGIDTIVRDGGGTYEIDHLVAPGADPSLIRLRIEGTRPVPEGDGIRLGDVVMAAPVAWQDEDRVDVAFVLEGDIVTYALGAYDASRPLWIDPVLRYSSFIGGGIREEAYTVAVHDPGTGDERHVYTAGYAQDSAVVPAGMPPNGPTGTLGSYDAWLAKFSYDLATHQMTPLWFMYIGGSRPESIEAVRTDAAGNVYLAGDTDSTNFPTLNPVQLMAGPAVAYSGATHAGWNDAFAMKLSSTGSLLFSTLLGAKQIDYGEDVFPDRTGGLVLVGSTRYDTACCTPYVWPVTPNALQPTHNTPAGYDGFVARIQIGSPTSSFVFSTLLGGVGGDNAMAVAVDGTGITVAGRTSYTGTSTFPTTDGAFMEEGVSSSTSDAAAFVTKYNLAGTAYAYSTLLDGSAYEYAFDMTLDAAGRPWVTGYTSSTDFPTCALLTCAAPAWSPLQASNGGGNDIFVAALSNDGSALVYGTYLGGAGNDQGHAIAFEPTSGHIAVAGLAAAGAPVPNALYAAPVANTEGYYARFDPATATLWHGSFFGADQRDEIRAIAIDRHWNVYLAGLTDTFGSVVLPQVNATQPSFTGVQDAFLAIQGKVGPTIQLTADAGVEGSVTVPPPGALVVPLNTPVTFNVAGSLGGDFPIDVPATAWTVDDGATTVDTGTGSPAAFAANGADLAEASPVTYQVCATVFDADPYALYDHSATACVNVTWIDDQPVALFDAAPQAPIAQDVAFTDMSMDAVGIVAWDWSFGDGATSTLQHPTHAFALAGTYTVRLTVTNTYGSMDTYTQDISIVQGPTAVCLGSSPVLTGSVVTFVDLSLPGDLPLQTWWWDFGDGATSATPAPGHAFTAPGSYTVRLTVGDGVFTHTGTCSVVVQDPDAVPQPDGYSVVRAGTLDVPSPGVLGNDADPAGHGLSAQIGTLPGHGSILLRPDGSFTYWPDTAFDGTDSFTYTANGAGPVTVTITVSPFVPPRAAFTFDLHSSAAQFFDLSQPGSGSIVAWDWSLGGTASAERNPHHVFPGGHRIVRLTVTDEHGLSDTAYATLYTPQVTQEPVGGSDAPVADAGPDRSAATGDSVVLAGSGRGAVEGLLMHYEWVQTHGPTVELRGARTAMPTFIAPDVPPGREVVLVFALYVHNGLEASIADTVTVRVGHVNTPPVAVAPAFLTADEDGIELDGSASWDADGDRLDYVWTSATGTLTAVGPTAHFSGPLGRHVVVLRVSDGTASDTTLVEIDVQPGTGRPEAWFEAVVSGDEVRFEDRSVDAVQWTWDFGDGQTSHARQPVHTYEPGTYTVTLTVLAGDGQTGVMQRVVTATAAPPADIDLEPGQAPQSTAAGRGWPVVGVALFVFIGAVVAVVAVRLLIRPQTAK